MLTPLALIGLAGLPVIVAFYMLRLRRRDVPVGSTFLWQQLVRDVEANAPWQRLRFSWLLLLQLLIALLAVLAAARPFVVTESDLSGNVVLVVDTSASMAVRTDAEDRMREARDRARAVVERLPDGGRITVVAASNTAEVLVAETVDRGAAIEAIGAIEATELPGDLTDAFALASALAARDSDSTVVVVTDAAEGRLPAVGIGSPVLVERVGATDANQSIAALSAVRRAGGAQLDLFVAVANPSTTDAARRLEVYADGELVDARDLVIPAGQRSEALLTSVPASAATVEARLAGEDALAADDRAVAVVPPERAARALIVGPGNAFLESALGLLPRLEPFAVGEAGYEDALAEAEADGAPYALLVFDGWVPDEPPDVPALYVDPDADGPFGTVEGRVEQPALAPPDPDEPLLRFVDVGSVHVGRARVVEPAAGVRALVSSIGGDPLVAAGEVDGRRLAIIGFDLRESDLPLQVAFPLLVSNLVDFLVPTTDGVLPSAMELGQPATLRLDPGLERVRVTLAGDAATTVDELDVRDGEVTLPGAVAAGLRTVETLDGDVLGRTAVNLFDADESDIAPGDPMRLVDMGRVPDEATGPSPAARSEWWWPLALAALALLAIEWIVFHRPTRRALVRALSRGETRTAAAPARSGR